MEDMNENKKENLGVEIHERIFQSIRKDRNRETKKNLTKLSLVVIAIISVTALFVKRDLLNSYFREENGREITADFLAGTLTESDNNSIKSDSLHIGKDKNEAIYLDQSQNRMVMNIAKMDLDDKDILNIKTGLGGFYRVELPDGSIVNLNANSNLHYAASYMRDRKLTLSGEAYFEVKKMIVDDKRMPFEVKTDQQTIKVLGTQFNVRTSSGFEETLLFEGSLDVRAVKSSKSNILSPGDLIRVAANQISRNKLNEGEIEELVAWKEGFLYYDNRSLNYILEDLKKYYDFDYNISEVPNDNFTIYLARDNNLEELISLLNETSFLNLKLQNKTIQFSKK